MIRIKPDKCGYTRFTCSGIPKMPLFTPTANPDRDNLYAEFDKLPLKVKGMVFVADTIDMNWTDALPVEVPELTCRSDLDPFSDSIDVSAHPDYIPAEISGTTVNYPVYGGTTGFIDLFHKSDYASKVYFTVGENTYGNIAAVNTLPTFDSTQILEPGWLEPMLDTDFKPINIDTITNVEAIIDGLDYSFINLNNWKLSIDDRIKNASSFFSTHVEVDTNLRDLKAAEYTESECDNFRIVLTSGSAVKGGSDSATNHSSNTAPDSTIAVGGRIGSETITDVWTTVINGSTIWHWTTEDGPNTYSISGGSVKYGDKTITVGGVSGVYAPFYAYLSITENTSVPYTNVDAQDVPAGSGPDGKIQDGDVLPSGGTITGFTSSVISGRTVYSWSTVGDTTGSVVVISGSSLPPTQVADPPPGCPGIGGVRVISGGSGNDAYTLYKIYHEDCLSEVDDRSGADAEDAVVGCIAILNGTESLVAVDSEHETPTAGIVQPVHNIQVKSTYPVSADSVPTVEAVFDFIHGYDTYGYGVADAKASERQVTNVQGTTAYSSASPGSVITIQKDRALQNTQETLDALTTASTNLATAEREKDDAELARDTAREAWEEELRKPADQRDESKRQAWLDAQAAYEEAISDFISAGAAYSTAYANCYGDVSEGEQGVVFTIDNIVKSEGHILGESGYTVPTVWGVDNFVHGIYALATVGTVEIDNGTYSKSEGTPGTVFTIDAINSNAFADGKYLEDEVPTVKAVVDYIAGLTGTTAAIPAAISGGTEYVNIEGSTEHNAGIVQPVVNIYVAGTVPTDLSDTAVPTVKAIHEYIHCTGSSNYDWSSSLATTGTMGSTVSVPATTAGVNGATATAPAVYGSTVAGAVPGTVIVVENIDLSGEDVDLDIVPTVLAVVDYIDSLVPVPGYIEVSGGNETWRQGADDPEPLEGLVFVAVNIDAGTAGVAHEAVPTVAAVKTYVDSVTGATTAVAGKLIESGDPAAESVVDVSAGITHTQGTVQPVRNIFMGTNATLSLEVVPTVDAIYNFVHDIHDSTMEWLSAKATIGVLGSTVTTEAVVDPETGTITTPEVRGSTVTGATPGTVVVVSGLDFSASDVPTYLVPTALAVSGYIDSLNPVPGTIEVGANGSETWVEGSTVQKGLVYTADNVDAGSSGIAHSAVPTVAAVKEYVDRVAGGTQAVMGYITDNGTSEGLGNIGDTTAGAGYVQPVRNIYVADMSSRSTSLETVPSVEAVYNFVHGLPTAYGVGGSSYPTAPALATAGGMVTADTEGAQTITFSGGIQGTCEVTSNIGTISSGGCDTVTAAGSGALVPTAEAVVNYIGGLGLNHASPGTLTTSGGSEAWASDSVATRGTVEVAKNIYVGQHGVSSALSYKAVPSVQAVMDFIHNNTSDAATRALATPGGMTDSTTITGGTPGTVYTVGNIISGGTGLNNGVPTVQAVIDFVSQGGGQPGSGDIPAPQYDILGGDLFLDPYTEYTISGDGWIRISTLSSFCCAIYIWVDGVQYKIGLGTGPMTWLLPLFSGQKIYVEAPVANTRIWFDGSCSPSPHAEDAGMQDPDMLQLRATAQEAINWKNSAAANYKGASAFISGATAYADRAEVCAGYCSNACNIGVGYCTSAYNAATWDSAYTLLMSGYDWIEVVGSATYLGSVYTCRENISGMGESDYTGAASSCADSASQCYTSALAQNAVYTSLGIAGGSVFVNMASSASAEAAVWYTDTSALAPDVEAVKTEQYASASATYDACSAYYYQRYTDWYTSSGLVSSHFFPPPPDD